MLYIDRDQVRRDLTFEMCVPLMRETMIAVSEGRTRQPLRSILDLGGGRAFGVMPGSLGEGAAFGGKFISVYPDAPARGAQSHQGLVLLFDPDTGEPVCLVHAGEVTAVRTAAASAAASLALAPPGASRLAVLGTGEQAWSHIQALSSAFALSRVRIWGRAPDKALSLVARTQATGLNAEIARSPADAVADAEIICTVTGAEDPVLLDADTPDGVHINLVGSSRVGQAEIDPPLVARSRFVADSRPGALAQGGEFARARAAGLIDDSHLAAEIGEVFAGRAPGRTHPREVTIYKSLGHVAQDLAVAERLYRLALARGEA